MCIHVCHVLCRSVSIACLWADLTANAAHDALFPLRPQTYDLAKVETNPLILENNIYSAHLIFWSGVTVGFVNLACGICVGTVGTQRGRYFGRAFICWAFGELDYSMTRTWHLG